jgi:hypothetical protein
MYFVVVPGATERAKFNARRPTLSTAQVMSSFSISSWPCGHEILLFLCFNRKYYITRRDSQDKHDILNLRYVFLQNSAVLFA